jgi:hypothetical protein
LGTSGNSNGQIKQNTKARRERGGETRALLQLGLAVSVSAAAAAERWGLNSQDRRRRRARRPVAALSGQSVNF